MHKIIKTKSIIVFSLVLLMVSCSSKKTQINKNDKVDVQTKPETPLQQTEDVERSFIDQQTSLELKKLSSVGFDPGQPPSI